MGRRRLQLKGSLRKKSGSWVARWREYPLHGEPIQRSQVIAPATGPDALNRRKAQRLFNEQILSKLDQRVTHIGSTMTLRQFVDSKFQVQVVERKKPATKKHYKYILGSFILPEFGHKRLCDVHRDDVETLVSKTLEDYSTQLAVHIKNAVSRIFNHAEALDCYPGKNPARGVDCGELKHTKRPTLTWDQAKRALDALPSPVREMAWLSIETSMNAAELCGLRRCWVNLTGELKETEGEALSPYSVAVRENVYQNKRGSLKKGKRKRNLPISEEMAADLRKLIQASPWHGEDFPLFCSQRGTPIDADNVRARVFAPLHKKLGFPVNWHMFRRAHSTFAGVSSGISLEARRLTMGHADAEMTMYYSVDDIEQRRALPQQIRKSLQESGKLKLVKGQSA